jgi:hypothetical protein
VLELNYFQKDIETILLKMKPELDKSEYAQMLILKDKLLNLNHNKQVKINHSVMELICAKHLILSGFEVDVEHMIGEVLCDVFATKGYGTAIVEVETGFISPENAIDPLTYLQARIASKITRYSGFANKFILATPPYYIIDIPSIFNLPPRFRINKEISSIKSLCDLYYTNPPVTIDDIKNARLHSIYAINVDDVSIREWEVNEYIGKATLWMI